MSIAFPDTVPATLTWGYQRNIVFSEAVNSKITRVSRTGDKWVCSMTLPPLTDAQARAFRSFLVRVSDVDEQALMQDHSYEFSGPSSLTPLVNGASQTGSTLAIDGLPNSTLIASAGDRAQLDTGQVVEIDSDATTNGSGQVTLSLATPLRSSPADNSAVEFYTPKALFIIPDSLVEWGVSAPLIHRFSLNFVEDI